MATASLPQPVKPIDPDIIALAAEIEDAEGLGHRAALVIAELMAPELAGYAASWDAWAASQRPICPMCGAAIEPRQYYVGGKGYMLFEVCSSDGSHYSKAA